ncbi:hypothetical protein [Prevotella intermedia]|nr:hypothetical protein [Prevotella intermedia]
MSIIELFKCECSFMKNEDNGDDCLVYPKISERSRAAVRSNFGINKEDTILLIRDTSFWSSRDQGLVVTDVGFYLIVDNDNPEPCNFGWECLSDVNYQELCLHFKDNSGEEAPIHINYFLKSADENHMARVGRKLAHAFKKMAKSVAPAEDPFDVAYEQYDTLKKQKKYQEALELCNECIDKHIGPPYFFHSLMADIYGCMKDWQKCAEYNLMGIKECEDYSNDSFKVYLQYQLYSAYHYSGNDIIARKDCLSVMLNATDQTCNGLLIKDDAKQDFPIYEQAYINSFLSFPYNERKVIMPVKKYVDLHQEHIAVISMQNLPDINFPMGHPIANQLYVGHPLIPAKYIPFENYQLELVEDRIREFCMLVQSLGATEISIECLNSASANQNNKMHQKNSGGTNTLAADGKANQQLDRSRNMIDELSRSVSLHQTFEPHTKPSIPQSMVWYYNEPSWQRLVSQRLDGGLTSHEERIETKKSQMVESRELSAIKAEIESLYVDMDIAMDKTEESKFAQQENAVLSIKVKFAPIRQLNGNAPIITTQITSSNINTPEEDEYLAELNNILSDGEISPRERRLLEKIRVKFGISEQRASELEESLTILRLSEEEQEYLNEYKEIIVDGEVSEKERRLLDKILKLNGISQERAREIEAYAKL